MAAAVVARAMRRIYSGGGDGCVRVVLHITCTCTHEHEFYIAEGVNADRYQCNIEDL